MSFQLPSQRKRMAGAPGWKGAAFIVESMLMLVFLAASLAVFVQVFVRSGVYADRAEEFSQAIAAASNTAERFAADPAAVPASQSAADGDLQVRCQVTSEPRPGGTLYHADITVLAQDGSVVYQVDTSRYVSGVV